MANTILLSSAILLCHMSTVLADFGFSRESDVVILEAGQQVAIDMNVTGIDTDIYINIESANPRFFGVEGNTTFYIIPEFLDDVTNGSSTKEPDLMKNHTLLIVLKGIFIGISELTFQVRSSGNSKQHLQLSIAPLKVKVRRKTSVLDDIFENTLIIFLFFSYISMGVKMNWSEIWKRLKRPWGVIIGALSQFIIMPAIAFGLAKIARLDNVSAVGLIVIGCCPGGYLSNIFTLMLECDLVLSITMTTVSTSLAFGMMPLNLFLYTREFIQQDKNLKTPYENIVLSLALLLIPIGIGIFCYYKLPKVTKYLKIILRPIAVCLIMITLAFGIPVNLYAFSSPPEIYLVSIALPLVGSTLGVLFAKIACLDNRSAITVAIETGFQNALVGLALARLSYPQPEADLIARGPILVYIFSLIEGSTVTGVYTIMKYLPGKSFDSEDNEVEDNKELDIEGPSISNI